MRQGRAAGRRLGAPAGHGWQGRAAGARRRGSAAGSSRARSASAAQSGFNARESPPATLTQLGSMR
jgi:hypothetical protein